MSLLPSKLDETFIGKELVEYFDLAKELYEWNYYASAWHLLLFTVSCLTGSDNAAWQVTLCVFTAVYLVNILARPCLYGAEEEEICGFKGTYVFLGVLFVVLKISTGKIS